MGFKGGVLSSILLHGVDSRKRMYADGQYCAEEEVVHTYICLRYISAGSNPAGAGLKTTLLQLSWQGASFPDFALSGQRIFCDLPRLFFVPLLTFSWLVSIIIIILQEAYERPSSCTTPT